MYLPRVHSSKVALHITLCTYSVKTGSKRVFLGSNSKYYTGTIQFPGQFPFQTFKFVQAKLILLDTPVLRAEYKDWPLKFSVLNQLAPVTCSLGRDLHPICNWKLIDPLALSWL